MTITILCSDDNDKYFFSSDHCQKVNDSFIEFYAFPALRNIDRWQVGMPKFMLVY